QEGGGYFDGPLPPEMCRADDARKEVLLLGSYHMSNPGADEFNLRADDVLAPRRQAEIEAVVARLARFAPTRVATEAPWGDTATLARYEAYLAGDREPGASEEEQIGFRLADRVGLDTIHPIDVQSSPDFASVIATASRDPRLAAKLGRMQEVGSEAIVLLGRWLSEGTIGSMLWHMNTPENLEKAHRVYTDFFVPVVVGDDYAGADMVATWYQRNLRIFANITRIATDPGDRVFVVFGQGHVPILRQLVIEHPDFCIEDALPYLERL
ncbi:MAG: DUF5694 domain-containing protein, partial [Gemmatimonadota bacterium]